MSEQNPSKTLREISLGYHSEPLVVKVGDSTLTINNGKTTLNTSGDVDVITTNGNININPPTQEQDDDPNTIKCSLDKRAVQVGDVLGQDYLLPEDLQRLNGWVVYNVTEEGVPQALEPAESSIQRPVNWYKSEDHMTELQEQGHKSVRFWTIDDCKSIFNNIVQGGHNEKTKLDISGTNDSGIYWLDAKHPELTAFTHYTYLDRPENGGNKVWMHKGQYKARVRAAQDVPELTR